MTKLIQRMREELVRRNFAESTMRTYLQVVEDFRRYLPTRLDQRGPDDIRRYQVHFLEETKLGVNTVVSHIEALRFFREDTQTPGDEGGPSVSEPAETPAPDDPDTGRSLEADRFCPQPVPLRHAVDDVFGGTAKKRVMQAEGEQHR